MLQLLISFSKSPLLAVFIYAFSPSFSVFNHNASFGDLYIFLMILQYSVSNVGKSNLFYPSYFKPYLVWALLATFSFIAYQITLCSSGFEILVILVRPLLFIFYLMLLRRTALPKTSDYAFFVILSAALIFYFSFIIFQNTGFNFSGADIWNYDVDKRLVGFRGLLLVGFNFSEMTTVGNDSINFGLFVCILSILSFSLARYSSVALRSFFLFYCFLFDYVHIYLIV